MPQERCAQDKWEEGVSELLWRSQRKRKWGEEEETEPKTEPWKMLIEGRTVSNVADDDKAPKDLWCIKSWWEQFRGEVGLVCGRWKNKKVVRKTTFTFSASSLPSGNKVLIFLWDHSSPSVIGWVELVPPSGPESSQSEHTIRCHGDLLRGVLLIKLEPREISWWKS